MDETYPGEADFVSEIVKAADAILSILVVMVLDKAEAEVMSARSNVDSVQAHTLCRGRSSSR